MANEKQLAIARTPFSVFANSEKTQKSIMNALGDAVKTKKFTASIISAVNITPALKECMPNTIITAALVGEALNLSPSPALGRFYIVPFANKNNPELFNPDGTVVVDNYGKPKKAKDAVFILGYKGYIELALRSGAYSDIDAIEVREGEYKGLDDLGRPIIEFIADDDERLQKEVVGYMAYLILNTGFKKKIYWSKSKMKLHANKYSSAFDLEAYNLIQAGKMPQKDMWKYSSYWYSDFDGMAFKTMLRQLISKWGIMTTELATAFANDTAVIEDDGTPNYVDNPNNEIENEEPKEVISNQKDRQLIEEYMAKSGIINLSDEDIEQIIANNKIFSYSSVKSVLENKTFSGTEAQSLAWDILEKGYHNADEFELTKIRNLVMGNNV